MLWGIPACKLPWDVWQGTFLPVLFTKQLFPMNMQCMPDFLSWGGARSSGSAVAGNSIFPSPSLPVIGLIVGLLTRSWPQLYSSIAELFKSAYDGSKRSVTLKILCLLGERKKKNLKRNLNHFFSSNLHCLLYKPFTFQSSWAELLCFILSVFCTSCSCVLVFLVGSLCLLASLIFL